MEQNHRKPVNRNGAIMQIYLAPMEGITGYIVRNAFQHHFGCIDKYYTPFIPAAKRLNYKIKRDILAENNQEIRLVPQLISNCAEETLDMIRQLKDYGYREFNLNLGCPSGTVVSKRRGSGLLHYPDELDRFLDGVYSHADVPVSIKSRIGYDSMEEWPVVLEILARYPCSEWIIHPRLRQEQYAGVPHLEAFRQAYESSLSSPGFQPAVLCYNGDIRTTEDYLRITGCFPELDRIMIGRGLLGRPYLAAAVKSLPLPDLRSSIRAFCDEIYEGYLSIFDGEKDAVMHMKEIWCSLGNSFRDSDRMIRKILKCHSGPEYKVLTGQLFDTLDLADV